MKNQSSMAIWIVALAAVTLIWAWGETSDRSGQEVNSQTELDYLQTANGGESLEQPQSQLPLHLQAPPNPPTTTVREELAPSADLHFTGTEVSQVESIRQAMLPEPGFQDAPQLHFDELQTEGQMADQFTTPSKPLRSVSEYQPMITDSRKAGVLTANSNSAVSNPFFGNNPAPASPLPGESNFTDSFQDSGDFEKLEAPTELYETRYQNFDDLATEQNEWVTTDDFEGVADPSLAPAIPRGTNLTLSPATVQRCANHIEQGRSLARRRAAYAAKDEFYSALRVIAQSHDSQTLSKVYTTALREAITALDEADDFFSERAHEAIDVDVARVVEAHASKIIPMEIAKKISSSAAIQAYFDYARQNFVTALGNGPVASETLYSLGKLYTTAANHQLTGNPFDYSKSTVLHYSALDCNPGNYKSANELGVLMARNGRLEKARDLFRDSLLVRKMPQTWNNLATVHQRLATRVEGPQAQEEMNFARMAHQEYQLALEQNPAAPRVHWISPEQYSGPAETFTQTRVADESAKGIKKVLPKFFR